MKKILYYLPAIIWIIVILILCLMPGEDVPTNSFFERIHFDKIVHFSLFAGIVFLFSLGIYWQKQHIGTSTSIWLAIIAAAFGFAIELVQKYWAIGRSFDLFDLLADTLGAIGGVVVFKLFAHWWFKPGKK